MSRYFKVEVSAETKKQAEDILNALLAKKLVTGGQIISAAANFLWKGQIQNMDYYTFWSFTVDEHRDSIIELVKSISVEEVPMIWFTIIDANKELLNWIDSTVRM